MVGEKEPQASIPTADVEHTRCRRQIGQDMPQAALRRTTRLGKGRGTVMVELAIERQQALANGCFHA